MIDSKEAIIAMASQSVDFVLVGGVALNSMRLLILPTTSIFVIRVSGKT